MSNVGLIDDGYMTAWGDWGSLKPKAFPTAFMLGPNPSEKDVDACMKNLSDSMRSNGMKPGIWLAPFAADKHSKLTKENPDWIIRDNSGRPVSCYTSCIVCPLRVCGPPFSSRSILSPLAASLSLIPRFIVCIVAMPRIPRKNRQIAPIVASSFTVWMPPILR